MKTFKELIGEFGEALKKTVVYRAGKKKIIRKSSKDGYKNVGGKEVKMKADEKRSRAKAMKKVAKKMGGKRAKMAKKRARTMRKRGDR
jgi:hypothetical protein